MKKYFLFFLILNISVGALLYPENGSTLNQTHVRFEWEQVPTNAYYILYVSENSDDIENNCIICNQYIENSLKDNSIKHNELSVYSSPTRLTIFTKDLAEKIKIEAKQIKGPKVGSPEKVIQGFIRSKNANEKDLIKKVTDQNQSFH